MIMLASTPQVLANCRQRSRYADLMADAEEPVGHQPSADERPSSGLIAERLGGIEADDDIELVHREMEFAAAERLMFFTDAVVAIALTLLALQLPVPGAIENVPDQSRRWYATPVSILMIT